MAYDDHVLVGIPTFKRPLGLTKLIKSLTQQDFIGKICILVVENDVEKGEGRAIAQKFASLGEHEICVREATPRGISSARNAILDFALTDRRFTHLLMIDDDEWAPPNWIGSLVATHDELNVDVVAGPVARVFECEKISDVLRQFNTVKVKAKHTSVVRSIEATSNLSIKLSFLRYISHERFDEDFSLTGGEDRDYLMRLRAHGATFGWCTEAYVFEDFPKSRSTDAWASQRSYRVGNSEMLAYLKNKPRFFAIKEAVKISLTTCGFLYSKLNPFANDYAKFVAKQNFIRSRGKIDALFGKRFFEYTTIHGK